MAHRHTHGPRSIDRLAYQSGMRGWNPAFLKPCWQWVRWFCASPPTTLRCPWRSFSRWRRWQRFKGKLPLRDYGGLLLVPLTFLLLGGAAVAWDVSAVPMGDWHMRLPWFYVCASADSVRFAAALVLKALGAVSAMYLLALTTTACELVDVLRCAHLPPLLCELMYLIYRFVFVLLDMYGRMRQAAGARLGWRDFRTSCRSFGGTAGNLLCWRCAGRACIRTQWPRVATTETCAFWRKRNPCVRRRSLECCCSGRRFWRSPCYKRREGEKCSRFCRRKTFVFVMIPARPRWTAYHSMCMRASALRCSARTGRGSPPFSCA